MDGRRHQQARLRHRFERVADVGGKERTGSRNREPVLPGQEDDRFQPVTMLVRHRPDDAARCEIGGIEPRTGSAGAGHQGCPGFRHGFRPAGGARGEEHHSRLSAGNKERRRLSLQQPIGEEKMWQVERQLGQRHICERIEIGIGLHEALQHPRRIGRRHERDLPAHQRGGEADHEAVAVLAEIDQEGLWRQQRGQSRDILPELRRGHARLSTIRHGLTRRMAQNGMQPRGIWGGLRHDGGRPGGGLERAGGWCMQSRIISKIIAKECRGG